MKKWITFFTLAAALFLLAGCNLLPQQTTTATTITVVTDQYIDVSTPSELQAMELNKSYRLTADIDLSGIEWVPIGTYNEPFLGIFDGNGHTISHLTITQRNDDFNGLFGFVNGDIINLTLTDVSINYTTHTLTYAGGVAGFTRGDVDHCTVAGDITVENTSSNIFVGLLTGYSESDLTTTIEDFVPASLGYNRVTGSVTAIASQVAYVGGLVGKTYNTTVHDNVATVALDVTANSTDMPIYVGGFIGHNFGGALYAHSDQVTDPAIYIRDNVSHSTLDITNATANIYAGGFMGFDQQGTLHDNFSESMIVLDGTAGDTNHVYIGGFLGENFDSAVERTFVSISVDVTGFDAQNADVNVYVAGDYADTEAIDTFIYTDMTVASTGNPTHDDIQFVTLEQKNSATFYADNLGWSAAFIQEILP